MNPFEKLSAAEMRRLGTFLGSVACPSDSMSLIELKGFLFAVCCSPVTVKAADWLPEVFNQRTPNYAHREEEQFVSLALIRLFNTFQAEVKQGTVQLPTACKYREPCGANFRKGASLHEWSRGFNHGYLHQYEAWEAAVSGDDELMAAVGYMVLTLGFFDDDEESRQMLGLAFDVDLPLEQMAPVVRGQMPQVMREFARIGRSLYEESLDVDVPVAPHARAPGSNVVPFRVPHAEEDAVQRLARAQSLAEEAIHEADAERRVALARKALSLHEDCADAYMVLAEDASDGIESADHYYRLAMASARRVLGEEALVSARGHAWLVVEARPYLRAKLGHADALWDAGDRSEAIREYEDLLDLNPEDNQGIRYILLIRYLDVDDLEKARILLERYEEDSAWWHYTRSLWWWLAKGDCARSRKCRTIALESNSHAPDFLSGKRRMPRSLPDDYRAGSIQEAVLYAHEARSAWRVHVGAVDWLLAGLPSPRKRSAKAPSARRRAVTARAATPKPSRRKASKPGKTSGGKG